MKRKENDSVFFGRSLVFLLIVLFVLTGAQMVLSQAKEMLPGAVLGEDSNEREGKHEAATVTPTVAAPITVVTTTPAEVSTEMTVVATPTIVITPEPTTFPTPAGSGQATEPVSPSVEVKSSNGVVITTTNVVDQSTSETVRQIISKFGISTAPVPTGLVAPTLKAAVKVMEERTAGEILRELAVLLPSRVEGPQVRLRYKFVNGRMTLVGETDTGQETLLSASESASIIGKLARSAALDVKPGGLGESVFTKGQIRAVTELPLLVDLRTNLLMTETSTGIKTVPLLPDEAIKIVFASGVVDGVYPKKSNAEIEFTEAENGRLVYQIEGLSKRKLFGLIPITLRETALVDTANGQVSQPDKSLGKLLVELMAFPMK